MRTKKFLRTGLILSALALIVSPAVFAGAVIARQPSEVKVYSIGIDQKGGMHLLGQDKGDKNDNKKDEFIIELPSQGLIDQLELRVDTLKDTIDKVVNSLTALKSKDRELEDKIGGLKDALDKASTALNAQNTKNRELEKRVAVLENKLKNATPPPAIPAPVVPPPAPPPAAPATAEGLVLCLQMNEGQGTTATDTSGSGNNGTITGASWVKTAGGAWTLGFDGVQNYVACNNSDSTNFTASDFTIECWVNISSVATNPAIVCRGVHLSDGYFAYVDTNKAIHFLTEQSGACQDSYTNNNALNLNSWTLVTFTKVGTTVNTYVNGVIVSGSHAVHANPTPNTRKLHIGIMDNETGQPFQGQMSLVRVYGRALAASEIQSQYSQEKTQY